MSSNVLLLLTVVVAEMAEIAVGMVVEMVVVIIIPTKAVIGITKEPQTKQLYPVFMEHLLCTSSYREPFVYIKTHSVVPPELR